MGKIVVKNIIPVITCSVLSETFMEQLASPTVASNQDQIDKSNISSYSISHPIIGQINKRGQPGTNEFVILQRQSVLTAVA